jgi:TolB-like protein/Tfp pilus assembly protein PilF
MRSPTFEPASSDKMAFPLPEKPSVAVLPFVNLTGDPNQEYLADAISDNIITALSTIPDIFVIDQNSALSFKGKSVPVKQVAEELGIQYVVEGSLQMAGEGLKLTTRVVDAIAGRNIWAKSFKKDLNNILDSQDEITINILKEIHVESIHGSDAKFYFGTKSIEARNYFEKGKDHYSIYDCKEMVKAIALYKKALEIDPDYAAAWASLAQVYHAVSNKGTVCGIEPTEARKLRTDCLTKALEIDSTAPGAHMLLAEIYQQDGQYEMAVKQLEDAIEKNPNSAELHFKLGELLGEGGRSKEAIALIERAMRLNPFYPWYYLSTLSRSYFLFKQYNDGLKIAKQLLDRGQKEGDKQVITSGHMWCAANLVELGQIEQAQAHMKEYLSLIPDAIVNVFEGIYKDRFQNPDDLKRICSALHKAGLPWYRF